MTLDELQRHYEILNQRNKVYEAYQSVLAKATPGGTTADGLPHGSETNRKIERYGIELADLSAQLRYYDKALEKSSKRIEEFLQAKITDSIIRTAIRLRFMRGLSWQDVADTIGSHNGETMRLTVRRYLYDVNG